MKKLLFLLPFLAFIFVAVSDISAVPLPNIGETTNIVAAQDATDLHNPFDTDANVVFEPNFLQISPTSILHNPFDTDANVVFEPNFLQISNCQRLAISNTSFKKPPTIVLHRYDSADHKNKKNRAGHKNKRYSQIGYSMSSL